MFTKVSHLPTEARTFGQNHICPVRMPEAKGDEMIEYVVTLRRESPMEFCTIGPLMFCKHMKPSGASLTKNEGKAEFQIPVYPVVGLTRKQANYILEAAEKKEFRVPGVDYVDEKTDEIHFRPSYIVKFADYIVLKPKSEFNVTEDTAPKKDDPKPMEELKKVLGKGKK